MYLFSFSLQRKQLQLSLLGTVFFKLQTNLRKQRLCDVNRCYVILLVETPRESKCEPICLSLLKVTLKLHYPNISSSGPVCWNSTDVYA